MNKSQATSGIYSILSSATFYEILQVLVGRNRAGVIIVKEYFKPYAGIRILDIGCGTGRILDYLPGNISYVGYDISPEYIAAAIAKYGKRGTFYCQDVIDMEPEILENKFDLVISIGVLHHLNDTYARKLITTAHSALVRGGRLITIDPAFAEKQSPIAKWIISLDRGKQVRTPDQYTRIVSEVFNNVKTEVRNDMLYIPYSHCICVAIKE